MAAPRKLVAARMPTPPEACSNTAKGYLTRTGIRLFPTPTKGRCADLCAALSSLRRPKRQARADLRHDHSAFRSSATWSPGYIRRLPEVLTVELTISTRHGRGPVEHVFDTLAGTFRKRMR
jgi:hypothetical protein